MSSTLGAGHCDGWVGSNCSGCTRGQVSSDCGSCGGCGCNRNLSGLCKPLGCTDLGFCGGSGGVNGNAATVPCPKDFCSPLGCLDLGCGCGCFCPPRSPPCKPKPKPTPELPCCRDFCCDKRAHHLNRSPYCCPCRPGPDPCVYRTCESLVSSYAGHVPGFLFHSLSRPYAKATFGTKGYMQNCMYYNTWSKI